MLVREIKLTEIEMKDLEKAFYEYLSMKDNMATMMEMHANDAGFFESDLFQRLADRQRDVYARYEVVKSEYTEKYIPEDLRDERYSWTADFANHKLVVNE